MVWEKELNLAIRASRQAGERLHELALGEPTILSASGRDIKLQADHASEAIILQMIARETPYPVLAEESGEVGDVPGGDEGTFWVVDPLDGTFNFSRGVPLCGVSIALIDRKEPVLGVIYDFNRNELFSALASGDGKLNNTPLRVSTTTEIGQASLATGFPVNRDFSDEALIRFVHQVQPFKKVRMIGTAATSLAWVACGRFDVYMEEGIMLWDVAAGLALARAAGAEVRLRPSRGTKWAYDVQVAANACLLDTSADFREE